MRKLFLAILIPIITFSLIVTIGFSVWIFKTYDTLSNEGNVTLGTVASIGEIKIVDSNLNDGVDDNFKLIIEQDNVYLMNQAIVTYTFIPKDGITDLSGVDFTYKITMANDYFPGGNYALGPGHYFKPVEDTLVDKGVINNQSVYEGRWIPRTTSTPNVYEFRTGIGFMYKEGRKPKTPEELNNLMIMNKAEIKIEFFATKKVV